MLSPRIFTNTILKYLISRNNALIKPKTFTTEKMQNSDNIVWIDLELTGLEKHSKILEIACIVTDGNLNIIAEGPNLIINQSIEVLNTMNEWCIENHAKTGLTQASMDSKITVKNAEQQVLTFLKPFTLNRQNPMAGNSIYMDRIYIREHMPILNEYLHYRNIDVSTIKELCKRWNPNVYDEQPQKRLFHRAMDDIRESINELKYYKKNMLK